MPLVNFGKMKLFVEDLESIPRIFLDNEMTQNSNSGKVQVSITTRTVLFPILHWFSFSINAKHIWHGHFKLNGKYQCLTLILGKK